MPALRRLTPAGVTRFEEYLAVLRGGGTAAPPTDALTSADHSEPLDTAIEVEDREFASRLEWAKYIEEKLEGKGLKNVERDVGLWAWRALFSVDVVCPADQSGDRKPGEVARYLLRALAGRRYYKHLLAGPYLIYRVHRDDPNRALAFLCGPVTELSEFVNQLASKQELVTNKAVLEAITKLYINPQTSRPKRGSTSNTPVGARRLAQVINQLDLTWDLCAIPADQFFKCLPSEFDRFQPRPTTPMAVVDAGRSGHAPRELEEG
jgi:hypothetical protein